MNVNYTNIKMDKKINLLGVNGSIGSGKDTFLKIFNKLQDNKWENKKFAENLKVITASLTGCKREDLENEDFKNSYLPEEWNYIKDGVEKRMTYRYFMQILGTEAMRDIVHVNIHVNALFSKYVSVNFWTLTDLRFPNEYSAIKKRGGICIKIDRYQLFADWLKYFGINIGLDATIIDIYINEKISKSVFLELLRNYDFDKKEEFFEKHTHASETLLNSANFDYIIKNDGTLEDFENKIKEFIRIYEL